MSFFSSHDGVRHIKISDLRGLFLVHMLHGETTYVLTAVLRSQQHLRVMMKMQVTYSLALSGSSPASERNPSDEIRRVPSPG